MEPVYCHYGSEVEIQICQVLQKEFPKTELGLASYPGQSFFNVKPKYYQNIQLKMLCPYSKAKNE